MHRKFISKFVWKRKTTPTSSSAAYAPAALTAHPSATHATDDANTIFLAATDLSGSVINGSELQMAGQIGLQIIKIVKVSNSTCMHYEYSSDSLGLVIDNRNEFGRVLGYSKSDRTNYPAAL